MAVYIWRKGEIHYHIVKRKQNKNIEMTGNSIFMFVLCSEYFNEIQCLNSLISQFHREKSRIKSISIQFTPLTSSSSSSDVLSWLSRVILTWIVVGAIRVAEFGPLFVSVSTSWSKEDPISPDVDPPSAFSYLGFVELLVDWSSVLDCFTSSSRSSISSSSSSLLPSLSSFCNV